MKKYLLISIMIMFVSVNSILADVGGLTRPQANNLYIRLDGTNWHLNEVFHLPPFTTVLLPVGTEGNMVYNTTTHSVYVRTNTGWVDYAPATGGPFLPLAGGTMSGDITFTDGLGLYWAADATHYTKLYGYSNQFVISERHGGGAAKGIIAWDGSAAYPTLKLNSYPMYGQYPFLFEGGTQDGITLSFEIADPTVTSKTITFPDVDGTVWTSGNDGTGSGLDADLYRGLAPSAFALAAAGVATPANPGDDGKLYRASAGTHGWWTPNFLTAEADTFATVTARGPTTAVATTSATHVQSKRYNASDPRPDGWPRTAANALDWEADTGAPGVSWSWHNAVAPSTYDATTYPGTLLMSNGSSAFADFLQLTVNGGTGWVSGVAFDVAACIRTPGASKANHLGIGIAILDTNGTGRSVWIAETSMANPAPSYCIPAITTWAVPATFSANLYTQSAPGEKVYVRITRNAANLMQFYFSSDGLIWRGNGSLTWASTVIYLAIGLKCVSTDASWPDYAGIDWVRVSAP